MLHSVVETQAEVVLDGTLSLPTILPATAGFKTGARGVMTSRTIMLAELRALLASTPMGARKSDYQAAIIEENVLAKRSVSNRRATAKRLAELYALDPGVPLFRLLRRLWAEEEASQPLLACLCANARDPLLRTTAAVVLRTQAGAIVHKDEFRRTLADADPDRFNEAILDKIARNAASSWTQSGHLNGHLTKMRAQAKASATSTAYALAIGYLAGARGALLYETYWTALLDASPEMVDALAFEAGRRGWLDYRRIGNVVELSFADLLGEEYRWMPAASDNFGPCQR